MTEGYCVKCKKKVEIQNPKESKTSKGTKIATVGNAIDYISSAKQENSHN